VNELAAENEAPRKRKQPSEPYNDDTISKLKDIILRKREIATALVPPPLSPQTNLSANDNASEVDDVTVGSVPSVSLIKYVFMYFNF
jgi:hypothetical protein